MGSGAKDRLRVAGFHSHKERPAFAYILQGRLTDIYKQRAEKVMFVKGDDAIPFANVANVIDIAHAAGVDKVGLITAKIEAGG